MRRDDTASTSVQRHFDVMCLLGLSKEKSITKELENMLCLHYDEERGDFLWLHTSAIINFLIKRLDGDLSCKKLSRE